MLRQRIKTRSSQGSGGGVLADARASDGKERTANKSTTAPARSRATLALLQRILPNPA